MRSENETIEGGGLITAILPENNQDTSMEAELVALTDE